MERVLLKQQVQLAGGDQDSIVRAKPRNETKGADITPSALLREELLVCAADQVESLVAGLRRIPAKL
jgi:hypothetical protein